MAGEKIRELDHVEAAGVCKVTKQAAYNWLKNNSVPPFGSGYGKSRTPREVVVWHKIFEWRKEVKFVNLPARKHRSEPTKTTRVLSHVIRTEADLKEPRLALSPET